MNDDSFKKLQSLTASKRIKFDHYFFLILLQALVIMWMFAFYRGKTLSIFTHYFLSHSKHFQNLLFNIFKQILSLLLVAFILILPQNKQLFSWFLRLYHDTVYQIRW